MDNTISKSMNRRDFLGASLAMLAGITITVTGCGDDNPAGGNGDGSRSGSIEANHTPGHTVTISKAELDANADVSLTLTSAGGHSHTIALTAADVANIRDGAKIVQKVSTTANLHNHVVTFSP